jgi:hypothetical protein
VVVVAAAEVGDAPGEENKRRVYLPTPLVTKRDHTNKSLYIRPIATRQMATYDVVFRKKTPQSEIKPIFIKIFNLNLAKTIKFYVY